MKSTLVIIIKEILVWAIAGVSSILFSITLFALLFSDFTMKGLAILLLTLIGAYAPLKFSHFHDKIFR